MDLPFISFIICGTAPKNNSDMFLQIITSFVVVNQYITLIGTTQINYNNISKMHSATIVLI